jgi:hypothetical protein
VVLLALVLRMWFSLTVIGPGNPAAWSAPDTGSYRSRADSLLASGTFSTGHPDVRVHALHRPPGYPLVFAAVRWMGLGDRAVLLLQVLCSTAMVAGLLFLAFRLTGRWEWSCLVAFVAALSPTGMASPSMLLADALFAFWVSVSILACFWPGTRRETLRAAVHALALVLALYLKPGLTFYLPISLLWWVAGSVHRESRWSARPLFLIILLQVCGWGLWTARNARQEGVVSFSKIGDWTIAHYWAVQARAIVAEGDLATMKNERMEQTEKAFRASPGRYPEVFAELDAYAKGIFKEHPRISLACFWQNIRENVSSPWSDWRKQLGLGPEAPAPFLEAAFAADGRWRGRLLWGSPFLLLPVVAWRLARHGRAAWPHALASLAALGTSAYFALISGVTFWTGSRILFPAETTVLLSYALLGARVRNPPPAFPCPTHPPRT